MSQVSFSFSLEKNSPDSSARAGFFQTAHSKVLTPVFMPVATHAAVRGQSSPEIEALGFQVLLANTYHLLLRPGVEVFQQFGGIHKFMNWPRSVLTDSGGYQLFSLSRQLQIEEQGAEFKSYIDGRKILLSPEMSIATQQAIQSDIMMVLDHCIEAPSDRKTTEVAMHRTHRWAKRSLAARGDSTQALFGIVQGGCFPDLRRESAAHIASLGFDGIAIGGVAVGEATAIRNDIVQETASLLPVQHPRYLMGVGTPLDLLESVHRGIDMFDCIIPTAFAHQGVCFTSRGRVKLGRGIYADAAEPLDARCSCSTCQRYSRAYLHHLLKAGEHLAQTLLGIHNLHFYSQLMSEIRNQILAGAFLGFYREQREVLASIDLENPISPPRRKSRRRPQEELGDYQLYRSSGLVFVRQKSSGEVMHSVTDPTVEAERLYIQQSGLRRRIRQVGGPPIVLWDVGLGAATNAMAAIRAYEEEAETGAELVALHIVSFEQDLDSLRLALQHPSLFPHLRHRAPHALLKSGFWKSASGDLKWSLVEGDFLVSLENAPQPDLIFFDPFSSKADSPLWTLQCFKKIFACTKPDTELFTYSASTAIRAGFLAAGFLVAKGIAIGPKEETTIVLRNSDSMTHTLLDSRWLRRWEKSQSKYPVGADEIECREVDESVPTHRQWK